MSEIRMAQKSIRRTKIIDQILETLKSDDIFKTLNYRNKSETYINQYMHQPLIQSLMRIHRDENPRLSDSRLLTKARKSILWEGDVKTPIHNIQFLGVQHRPDFIISLENEKLRIAIEIRRGNTGAAIREGIGQSLVYASSGDIAFVIYLFIDKLWLYFNIRFCIV